MKDLIGLIVSKFSVLLLSILVVVVQARALGPEDRGLLAALLVLPQLFISITDGGMRQSVTYFIGKKSESIDEILGSIKLFTILSLSFWLLILFVFQFKTMGDDVDSSLVLASLLVLPFAVITNSYRGVFLGIGRISNFSRTLLVPRVIYSISIVIAFFFGILTLENSVILFVLLHFLTLILAKLLLLKEKVYFRLMKAKKDILVRMFKLGIVYAISLFFIDFNYRLGLILARDITTPFDVGNYAVALQLSEFIWQIPAALSIVVFSKSANRKVYDEDWIDKIKLISRVQMFFGVIFCCFALLASFYMFPYLFGDEYNKVFPIFLILLPGILFMSTFKLVNVDLAGRGKPYQTLKFMPCVLLFTFIIGKYLFSHFGIYGISFSVTLSYILASLLIISIYEKSYSKRFSITDYFLIKRSDFKFLYSKVSLKLKRT